MMVWTCHWQNRPATHTRSALSILLALALGQVAAALDFKDLDDELLLRSGTLIQGRIQGSVPRPAGEAIAIQVRREGSLTEIRSYPAETIQELRYRGDLQLAEAEKRLGAGAIESAWEALQQLGAELPDWRTSDPRRRKIGLAWAELLNKSSRPDRAALVLRETRRLFPSDSELTARLTETLAGIARASYEARDFPAFRRQLTELEGISSRSKEALALREQLDSDFAQVMKVASEALASKNGRLALDSFETALLLKPESSEVIARVKELRKSYQRFQYGEPARILGFDPVLNDSPAERRIQRFLFSGMVRHQRDPLALAESTYSLDLARSIRPSPDGRKLYIALRKDIRWSDGELITAEDVLATIQVMCASETPNRDAMLARLIDLPNCQIRSADNLVLSLNFSSPRPRMILDFAVLPRRQLGDPPKIAPGSALANNPTSSAAFTLEKIDGPTTILLGREGFIPPGEPEGRWPILSEVRVTSFADPTTARTRLENQQIDLLTELHPADVQRLQANGQFKVEHQPANQVTFLAFNHRQKVFQGRTGFLLRKSINLAIDRETLLRENYQARRGLGSAHRSLTGPFPRSSYAYDESLPGYSFNPTLARQTLAQSRQKDLTLRLIHLPDPIVTSVCVLIKKQLQEIGEDQGLQIRLVKLTPALFRKAIEGRSFDIAYCNHSYDRPLLDLETLLADGETGEGGRNYMGYRHPDLARTFDLLRMTDLWTKISALSQELHRHCHENAVMVPLWQLDSYFAYSERLEGLDLHPSHLFGAPWSLRVR